MGNLVQQAGIHCANPEFHVYVAARRTWRTGQLVEVSLIDAEYSALWVRMNCGIQSRAELNRNHKAGLMWLRIVQDFRRWKNKTGRRLL